MKRIIPIIISMMLGSSTYSKSQIKYPETVKENHIDTYFGKFTIFIIVFFRVFLVYGNFYCDLM